MRNLKNLKQTTKLTKAEIEEVKGGCYRRYRQSCCYSRNYSSSQKTTSTGKTSRYSYSRYRYC